MPPSPAKSKNGHKSSSKLFRMKEKERLNGGIIGSIAVSSNVSIPGSSGMSGNSIGTIRKDEVLDIRDCPLTLPEVLQLDHTKSLPRYTALYWGEGISMEELDGVQLELELLLSSIHVLQMSLSYQVSVIEQLEKGKVPPKMSASPGKRGQSHEVDRPSKKVKEQIGKAREVSSVPGPPPGSKHLKVKCSVVKNEPLFDVPDVVQEEAPKPSPLKNDITNRFWAMVDQYCQEITADDIKVLEDLLNCQNEDTECYKVPPLGKHYSLRWAQEDLMDEQKEGSKLADGKKKKSEGGDFSDKLLREVDMNGCNDDVPPMGPLAQRVIAALIEQNVLVSDNIENKAVQAVGVSRPGFMKSLGVCNPLALEKRIKKELQDQGILDVDNGNDDSDDEILAELKRCQTELKAVSSHNNMQLTRLLRLAKDALVRHDLKKKLRDADAKVIEAYRTIAAARQKKKTPSKRDKEVALKALKDRDAIVRNLDLVSNSGC